jgi:hypothetical protein
MRARRAESSIEVETMMVVLERERAQRSEAERRAAALERTLAERTDRWARAYAEIDQIRDEIGELRRVFAQIEPGAPPPSEPAGPVQAERLADALTRLRERAEPEPEPEVAESEPPSPPERTSHSRETPAGLRMPPPTSPRDRYAPLADAGGTRSVPPPAADPAAEPTRPAESVAPRQAPTQSIPPPAPAAPPRPANPWLWPIFRSLTRDDPVRAGQLLLHLLPAWHAVHPLPVAGDLILGDRACVQVTMGAGTVEVRHADAARRPEDVHFQARGDLTRLARAVAAGRVRRRLGRRMVRVTGDHEAFARLGLLVHARMTLGDLHANGVRLDPAFTFDLLTRMIDPAWTVGERFTIAHRLPDAATATAHVSVNDGAPASAGEGAPAGPEDTTIVCGVDALLAALTRESAPEVTVQGRPEPLQRLVDWVDRAQCG